MITEGMIPRHLELIFAGYEAEGKLLIEKKKEAKQALEDASLALTKAQRHHAQAVKNYRDIKQKLGWYSRLRLE